MGCDDEEGGEEDIGPLFVAGVDASEVLEPTEEALDDVALARHWGGFVSAGPPFRKECL